jgi:eukaryotic-like serine/threonine-protein kinase
MLWSADSHSLVFTSGGRLKRTSIPEGPVQTICDVPGVSLQGGFWTTDNRIVFGTAQGGLFQVAASGGVRSASAVTIPDHSRRENNHFAGSLLPDGQHFLYTIFASPDASGVYVGSLNQKPEEQGRKKLLPDRSMAYYVTATKGDSTPDLGYLLFVRENTLEVQQFDASKLELRGEAVPLVGDVTGFSVSANGTIEYSSNSRTKQQLTWFDRKGTVLGTVGEAAEYNEFALSPDGKRIAVPRYDGPAADTWILDATSGAANRLTFNQAFSNTFPAWSPTGDRIAFASSRNGPMDLFKKTVTGGNEDLIFKSGTSKRPQDWSLDGRYLLYTDGPDPKTKSDLWVMPMDGSGKPFVYAGTEFNEGMAQFSPDSRWVAYASDESGTVEVYVQSFPASNEKKFQISHGGGSQPHWRRDGKELFFTSRDENVVSVEITTEPVFKSSTPQILFRQPPRPRTGFTSFNRRVWDVTADGQRFLFSVSTEQRVPDVVWLNWQTSLRK